MREKNLKIESKGKKPSQSTIKAGHQKVKTVSHQTNRAPRREVELQLHLR